MSSIANELQSQLIWISSDIFARGLTKASAGNVSYRDPNDPDYMFVSATGLWLNQLTGKSFVRMPIAARQSGEGLQPSTEWRMHAMTYLQRPDVSVIIHAHPKYSTFMDVLGLPIKFYTLDHVSYVQKYTSSPFDPNGSWELAEGVAKTFSNHDVVLMSHHGAVVAGQHPLETYRKLLNLEDAAEYSYMARMIGDEKAEFPANIIQTIHL